MVAEASLASFAAYMWRWPAALARRWRDRKGAALLRPAQRCGEVAGHGIEAGEIDALGDALCGVGAEVDEGGRRRRRGLLFEGIDEGLGLAGRERDAREPLRQRGRVRRNFRRREIMVARDWVLGTRDSGVGADRLLVINDSSPATVSTGCFLCAGLDAGHGRFCRVGRSCNSISASTLSLMTGSEGRFIVPPASLTTALAWSRTSSRVMV